MRFRGIEAMEGDKQDIARAAALVKLGAQMQLLESETKLPRETLLRLYQSVHKKMPPKGMLPFSSDWFMKWQPNTHASVFLNVYDYLAHATDLDEVDALVKSYQLYLEQLKVLDLPEVLSVTHAWHLVKFVDAGILTLKPCTRCQGAFVVHTLDLHEQFLCILCHLPDRGRHGGDVISAAKAERLN